MHYGHVLFSGSVSRQVATRLPGGAAWRFERRRRGAFDFANRRAGARLHQQGLIDAAALAHVSVASFCGWIRSLW